MVVTFSDIRNDICIAILLPRSPNEHLGIPDLVNKNKVRKSTFRVIYYQLYIKLT